MLPCRRRRCAEHRRRDSKAMPLVPNQALRGCLSAKTEVSFLVSPGGAAPVCNPGGGGGGSRILVKSGPTCRANTLKSRHPLARRGHTRNFYPAVLLALLCSTNGGWAGGWGSEHPASLLIMGPLLDTRGTEGRVPAPDRIES